MWGGGTEVCSGRAEEAEEGEAGEWGGGSAAGLPYTTH